MAYNEESVLVQPYLIGESQQIRDIRNGVKKIVNTDVTVLLLGETGTGKSLLALSMHNNSIRRNKPFVKVNCASIPRNLIESDLFGYKHGTFTGAYKNKVGKFEHANNGTLFLDEVSEMALETQCKLLQVLQDNEFTPIGGLNAVKVNVRVIAATNANLEQMISCGTFRSDLYYRLAVLCFHLPSLKDRKEDVVPLAYYFIDKFSKLYAKKITSPSPRFWEALLDYHWPGNVRELENIIKKLVVLESEEIALDNTKIEIKQDNLLPETGNDNDNVRASKALCTCSLREATRREREIAEKAIIQRALKQAKGDKKKTADLLQVSYKCILNKIKHYRL